MHRLFVIPLIFLSLTAHGEELQSSNPWATELSSPSVNGSSELISTETQVLGTCTIITKCIPNPRVRPPQKPIVIVGSGSGPECESGANMVKRCDAICQSKQYSGAEASTCQSLAL